ncbi:MAG: sulfatase-like hydrolase/transferase [Bacteroidetes bacterium]|nr:sulfatase-like hydrolase/transferase [Bacteroidota bacterium]
MKSTLSFFFRHYLFWILLFICFRVVFLINQSPWNDGIAIKESIVSIVAGFRLDFSTASYFAAVPFLLTIILIFGLDKFIAGAMNLYYQLLLFIVILLSISNIILYKNWGTLLNNRGLSYAMQPTEMLASVSGIDIVFILGSIAIIFVLFNFIYKKFVHTTFKNIIGTSWMRTSALIFMLPIIGIGIRGGLQLIPINESSAYFSNKRVLNNIAINNIWYLGHNLKQSDVSEKNPYTWMDDNKALQIKNSLFIPVQDRENIFNLNKQPNLVFILLESWTADIIEPLGGIKGVTPFFTSLASKGLLFSSVYSSGFRTDQALVSVISGFPAQPNKSIIRFPDKTSALPSIASILKKRRLSYFILLRRRTWLC